jgi:threonine dehydratase
MSDRRFLELEHIQQAHERIKDAVRRTPCLRTRFFHSPTVQNASLSLKLECLQVSGSFKARGASNKVLTLAPAARQRGLVTASGGNHGLGVAYAGRRIGAPVHVYLPASTPASKAEKLERWGAHVIFAGEVWDDANARAQQAAERDGMTYVHPFADPAVMAGQGTVGLEILKQSPSVDTVVVSIGGGGLISGVATALKASKAGIKVIGVEPSGAPTLTRSIEAGRIVELDAITTEANTLAPRRTEQMNLDIVRECVDEIVLVEDDDMRAAARWLWFEMGLAIELSAGAAVAALRTGAYRPSPDENICAVVCGSGTDGLQ